MHTLKRLRSYGVVPRSILHIGAHWGQEAADYWRAGARSVIFVEAIPTVFRQLTRNLAPYRGFRALCAVCSNRSGAVVQFNVASNDGGSSSILPLGDHALIYPDIGYVETLQLTTTTADELMRDHAPGQRFDLLVLDTQGSEISVLRGASQLLEDARALLIEVSEVSLYKGGCTFDEVTAHVRRYGFRLRQVDLRPQGWGDALYVKIAVREVAFTPAALLRSLRRSRVVASLRKSLSGRREREREIAAIRESGRFDCDWYLARYPDVRTNGLDPIRHYVEHGWRERRDPGPDFSTKRWLKDNPGFEHGDRSPLMHDLRRGRAGNDRQECEAAR